MKVWWAINSIRLGTEKAAVERLQDEHWYKLDRWLIGDGGRIAADGTVVARGKDYPVRLIYPDQFPSVPAWVQPRDGEARWSSHQYGKGGSLCLELRPDNWNPQATGADVLRSAFRLLETENPLGEGEKAVVESAHHVGEIQRYDEQLPVIISAGCMERITSGSAEGLKALRWEMEDDMWPILISDAEDRKGALRPPASNADRWANLPVTVAHAEPPGAGEICRSALLAAMRLDAKDVGNPGVLLVLGSKSNHVYHLWGDQGAFRRRLLVIDSRTGVRSGRKCSVASAAIVGAGSVGSKIAEILIRSGVGKLVLVDGDILLPGNLERHSLDWRDVGFLKVNALKRRLLSIAPGADIRVITSNLNWQRSARTHAAEIDTIAGCDIIVDGTGDSATTLFLGAIAAENELPFVTALVFEGGLGVLIARSVPSHDVPYVDGLAAFNGYCDQNSVKPPVSGQKQYESFNEQGQPVVADDAAVTIAAAHAAHTVLDILDGVQLDKAAWLLIGCRKGWVFQRHGHAISLDVGEFRETESGQDETALAFAEELLKDHL